MTQKSRNWGGKRPGAGRPKSSEKVSHLKRPEVGNRRPLEITLKVRRTAPSLRCPEILEVFEKATHRARRFGLRVIHYAICEHKIVLIVELKKQEELERSFKSLNTSLAIALKKLHLEQNGTKHEGPVFLGRFEMKILTSPEETKDSMRRIYTLAANEQGQRPYPDEYSSAPLFKEWKQLLGEEWNDSFEQPVFSIDSQERAKKLTALPQFWLTQRAWKEE